MRISDWSSDVCSSDLSGLPVLRRHSKHHCAGPTNSKRRAILSKDTFPDRSATLWVSASLAAITRLTILISMRHQMLSIRIAARSEEHTSELQSLMRISYAVFCLKKKTTSMPQMIDNVELTKHRK